MARDLVFQLRLDEEDRDRLDALAKHYAAPRATAVRMMIKQVFDQLGLLYPLRSGKMNRVRTKKEK